MILMLFQVAWCRTVCYGDSMDGAHLIMGMFSTMAALIVASIWNQHREAARTRAECSRQIERASKENTHQIGRVSEKLSGEFDKLRDEFNEHRRVTRRGHDRLRKAFDRNNGTTQRKLDKITDSLADARERLARIEGRLETAGPSVTNPELDSSEAA